MQAIERGEEATIKEWLEKEETKVNECKGGEHAHGHFCVSNGTALHWAAYYGQSGIAKLLLDNRAGMHYDKCLSPLSILCEKCISEFKHLLAI